jgi:hypothetical protein
MSLNAHDIEGDTFKHLWFQKDLPFVLVKFCNNFPDTQKSSEYGPRQLFLLCIIPKHSYTFLWISLPTMVENLCTQTFSNVLAELLEGTACYTHTTLSCYLCLAWIKPMGSAYTRRQLHIHESMWWSLQIVHGRHCCWTTLSEDCSENLMHPEMVYTRHLHSETCLAVCCVLYTKVVLCIHHR